MKRNIITVLFLLAIFSLSAQSNSKDDTSFLYYTESEVVDILCGKWQRDSLQTGIADVIWFYPKNKLLFMEGLSTSVTMYAIKEEKYYYKLFYLSPKTENFESFGLDIIDDKHILLFIPKKDIDSYYQEEVKLFYRTYP